jgi:hypothetical protein
MPKHGLRHQLSCTQQATTPRHGWYAVDGGGCADHVGMQHFSWMVWDACYAGNTVAVHADSTEVFLGGEFAPR